jgi:hypothetical protein
MRDARDAQTHAKKGLLKPWQKHQWCISLERVVGAELVWPMEEILKLYAEDYDCE